ncbi:MAG: hypothetical protein JWO05_3687 [Gemmatimonadetes bacterium]|nr:hypothetical protein [Gemmatimonadota bacterium]
MTDAPVTQHDVALLRTELRNARRWSRLSTAALLLLAAGAWTSGHRSDDVLHVRGLVVEDSLGHPRVVIGAPLTLEGRSAAQSGAGVAVLGPNGKLRAALGAPTPAPQMNDTSVAKRISGSAGLVIADEKGNERGGFGVLGDGRANACLDYSKGRKEATCIFVDGGDEYAGLMVNGTPSQPAYDRLTALVGNSGVAIIKIATTSGRESAMLKSVGMGPAQLLVYDSVTKKYRDVISKR